MLEIGLISILTSLIIGENLLNPATPFPDSYYPSGNNDADKVYSSDKPPKDYPLLRLDVTAYDSEFNKIEPGLYPVEYSPEYNVLFINNGKSLVKATVFQTIKLNSEVHIPTVKEVFIKDNKAFIIYRNKHIEVQSFLYLPEAILESN